MFDFDVVTGPSQAGVPDKRGDGAGGRSDGGRRSSPGQGEGEPAGGADDAKRPPG